MEEKISGKATPSDENRNQNLGDGANDGTKDGASSYGSGKGILTINMGPVGGDIVLIMKPEMYRDALVDTKNIRKNIFYFLATDYLGTENLLFADGATWKTARKLTTPAFHLSVLDQFTQSFNTNADLFVDGVKGQPITSDLYRNVSHFLMRSFMETSLGINVTQKNEGIVDEYLHYFDEYNECYAERITNPILAFDAIFFFTPTGRKRARAIKFLHDFTTRAILERMDYLKTLDEEKDGGPSPKKSCLADTLIREHWKNPKDIQF